MSKKYAAAIVIVAVAVVAAAVFVLRPRGGGADEVKVLCGGSMRAALEEIIQQYGRESSDKVLLDVGGSGELCANIKTKELGDVFVCHDPFMPWAAKLGRIEKWQTVGYLDIVLVVPKDNPKGIEKLADLTRPGLRVGIGDRTYSTSGQIVKQLFARIPEGEAILKNVRLETKGHQQRCTDVALGNLDAAIVWQAVAHRFRDKLRIIDLEAHYGEHIDTLTSPTYKESDLRNVQVTVGVMTWAKDRPAVKRFYDFVVGPAGRAVFAKHGFRTKKR